MTQAALEFLKTSAVFNLSQTTAMSYRFQNSKFYV